MIFQIPEACFEDLRRRDPLDVEVGEVDVDALVLLAAEQVVTLGVARVQPREVGRREGAVRRDLAPNHEPAHCSRHQVRFLLISFALRRSELFPTFLLSQRLFLSTSLNNFRNVPISVSCAPALIPKSETEQQNIAKVFESQYRIYKNTRVAFSPTFHYRSTDSTQNTHALKTHTPHTPAHAHARTGDELEDGLEAFGLRLLVGGGEEHLETVVVRHEHRRPLAAAVDADLRHLPVDHHKHRDAVHVLTTATKSDRSQSFPLGKHLHRTLVGNHELGVEDFFFVRVL